MKRRELIKSGLLLATTGMLGAGSEEINKENSEEPKQEIIPKQTGTYEFSVAMPFNYQTIDDLARLNKKYKKSQIVTLYNSIPSPMSDKYNLCFEINRGENENIKSMDDFVKYAKYAQNRGFKVCYLMNSAKAVSEDDFNLFKKDFYKTLDKLHKNNINDVKFANTQIASLINESGYKFDLSVSTVCEYHSVIQYKKLIENYPNIKLIDVVYHDNQNFKFLRGMRKAFPNIKLELMVNEYCIKGCPARISHVTERKYHTFNCHEIIASLQGHLKTSQINPWDLEYYSAIGCNNFKFVSNYKTGMRSGYRNIKPIELYLDMIEYGIDKYKVSDLFEHIENNSNLIDVIEYFPKMEYFVKYGDKCATNCGVSCNYCVECADKLEKVLFKELIDRQM